MDSLACTNCGYISEAGTPCPACGNPRKLQPTAAEITADNARADAQRDDATSITRRSEPLLKSCA